MGDDQDENIQQPIEEAEERSDRGASLVEYALLVSLIAVVCIAALNYFQQSVTESFSESSSAIVAAGQ